MVYCGRPSTSCNNCRAKKRRCDKAVPECGQCRRTGQKCHGYRDPSSLIFRDESTHVINRARSEVSKRTSRQAHVQNQQQSSPASDVVDETMLGMSDVDVRAGIFMPELMSPFNPDETGLFSLHQDASPSAMPVPASVSNDVALDQFPATSSQPEAIARPFSLPLAIIGLDFFLSHYVVRQSGPSSGFFDYVPAMLAQDDGGNDMLESAILAVGFSGLGRTTSQADLLTRSMMMYTRTVERVNLALADPRAARRDSTIVSVLVLTLYEFGRASIDGWKHHTEGATSLLHLRGRSQFSTSAGLQIFKDVFFQTLTNCLRSGSPMPSSLRMLRIEAANAIGVSDPYWVACSGLVELLDLYQHISPGGYSFLPISSGASSGLATPSDSSNSPSTASGSLPASTSTLPGPLKHANISIEHLERYLSQAFEVDYRLESTFSKCPSEWQFAAESNSSSNGYESDRSGRDVNHFYHDVWIASVWNSMRVCRILANHAISHLLLRGANADSNWFFANNYADRLHQATQTIVSLRDEILASVPQLMGHATSPAQAQQQQQQAQQHERSKNNVGSAIGGYFACWALLTVGCMHNLGHETRAWTAAQLRTISRQAGLAQADDFAHFVESSSLRPPLSG